MVHQLQQWPKELHEERWRELHAPPSAHLVKEDSAVSCCQPPQFIDTGIPPQHFMVDLPLAIQFDLLHGGNTMLGLHVGADPKEPACPAMVVRD